MIVSYKPIVNFIKDDLIKSKELFLDVFKDYESAEFLMATCEKWLTFDDLQCTPTKQPFEYTLMNEKQL